MKVAEKPRDPRASRRTWEVEVIFEEGHGRLVAEILVRIYKDINDDGRADAQYHWRLRL